MAGRELRRTLTLSEQLSSSADSNLRDLLKVRGDSPDDEIRHSRRRFDSGGGEPAPTLESVLSVHKRDGSAASAVRSIGGAGASSGKTLFDIIREEQEATEDGINWKSFKDRIRLRRAGAAFTSAGAAAASHPSHVSSSSAAAEADIGPFPSSSSVLSRSVASRSAVVSEDSPPPIALAPPPPPPADGNNQPVRVSLMALLEQTDGFGGLAEEEEEAAAAEEEEEEEEEEAEEGGGGMYYVCCVCMVRHKGAAFIPCGHTFCRLCSRELWVSRGNCPLCNGFILEILDIF